jgi:hypothetical protein
MKGRKDSASPATRAPRGKSISIHTFNGKLQGTTGAFKNFDSHQLIPEMEDEMGGDTSHNNMAQISISNAFSPTTSGSYIP